MADATTEHTFLFTDIERSTEMWQRYPATMPEAIARHDAILTETIADHGGRVFKTVGDAVHAVFDDPPGAVSAALAAQRALRDAEWPIPEAPAVRMALHAGPAEERGGDYFGLALSRAARILSAGHGGQVLLSQAVERVASTRFPEGAALRDLGERRLKDLTEPQRIFQLVVDDLPAEFPPLVTLDARPHNLPAQTTPLIGRQEELEEVRGLLLEPGVRLVTLVGPGGTGKTRLATQAAAEVLDAFADGVFLVNLAPIHDPSLVAAEILRAAGERTEGEEPDAAALRRFLAPREMLLVLDNFEQVVAAASLVADLLHAAPRLVVLATSQAALRLQGEHEVRVGPLDLPDPGRAEPERMASNEAVSLFVQRARAASPGFRLTADNAPAVASIVRELDGLPLAIELAAARSRTLPPERLLERLRGNYDLVSGRDRDRPERHRALRTTIDWSYGLLEEDERALFRRQAVFDGGFSLEAAEAVCTAPEREIDVLEGLESLVDKSLVLRVDHGGHVRFERLRTLRAYAVEKLEASGEADFWRRRHAAHFAAFAARLDEANAGYADVADRLERLPRDIDNLRAALAWTLEKGEASLAVDLTRALPAIWFTRGGLEEGKRWLERVCALGEALAPVERARVLNGLGRLGQVQGDNSPRVVGWFEESLTLFRAAGKRRGEARALMSLGNVHRRLERFDEARERFEAALAIYRDLDDVFGISGGLMNLGEMANARGDLEAARASFEEAAAVARRGRNRVGEGYALQYLGALACQTGALDEAAERFAESRRIFESLGSGPGLAWLEYYEATLARKRGDLSAAREILDRAIDRFRTLDYRPGLAGGLLALAAVDALEERCDRAARLFGFSKALHEQARTSMSPLEDEAIALVVERCRAGLGDEAFEAAVAEGAAMDLEAALGLALAAAA